MIKGLIKSMDEAHQAQMNGASAHKQDDAYVHHILMQAPVAVAIFKGKDYRVEFANDAYLALAGKKADIMGKTVLEIFPELESQRILVLMNGVTESGVAFQADELELYLEKQGETIQHFFNFVYQPLRKQDGAIEGIIVTAADVTVQVNARKKCETAEHFYSELIYASPSMMAILKGENMVIEIANDAILETWDKGKEVFGKSLFDVLPEIVEQGLRDILQNVYKTGISFQAYEMPLHMLRHGKLELMHYNFIYQAHRDQNGKITGVAVIANEVTAQVLLKKKIETQKEELAAAVASRTHKLKKAIEALRQKNKEIELAKGKLLSEYARSLIEASLDPLITISPEGKITDMNQAFVDVTGKTRKQLTGTDFFDYFTDPQKAREVYEEVFAKGFAANYPLTIKDHQTTEVLFNGSVYKDEHGTVLGVVVVARDITEQKRIEKEVMEAKVFAELATLVAEEAKNKAEGATLVAEDAVKSKQQFLSNMSHEIRTPMNAIIGFTKVMLKTDLSAKQKEYLNAIKLSGDALIVLINDILDLAKVDAGKMTFENTPFKMALSLSAMLHLFEPKIQEKNLRLIKEYDAKIPDVLLGDPVRLHQIILNLVSNAVKFTAKGHIKVGVQMLKEDKETATLEFSVADTGIGIAKNKLNHIFENFQQASSETSRLFGGTGLGLAIAKQLVESQGGSIQVKSIVDKGSVFSFTLDFKKTDVIMVAEDDTIALDTDNNNIKVLVVEDMALNQLLMKTVLDDFGFERDIADNGVMGIEKLRNKTYDIILMDLQMPEMNGFEATEYIRNTMHSKIPIIALTADVTTADLAKCKSVGMNDYISKPVDERVLYSKIVGLVKKPVSVSVNEGTKVTQMTKTKYTNLHYLSQRTKNNAALMMEMIAAYLEQTPPLIIAMKQSAQEKDWDALHAAVHKMIPSFAIVGINADFEGMAKKVMEYARSEQQREDVHDMVLQIATVCSQACEELEIEFNTIKNTKS